MAFVDGVDCGASFSFVGLFGETDRSVCGSLAFNNIVGCGITFSLLSDMDVLSSLL